MKCAIRLCSLLPTHSHLPGRLARARIYCFAHGLSGSMPMAQVTTVLSPRARSSLQRLVLDWVYPTWVAASAVERERRPVEGRWSRCQHNDVSVGRNARYFRWRCGGSLTFRWSWWRCHVRLPHVLAFFLNLLMTAQDVVAGSLLVEGPSSLSFTVWGVGGQDMVFLLVCDT